MTQFRAYTEVVTSSIYSFQVGEQSDTTLDLLHQFEHNTFTIDGVDLGPRAIVIQGCVSGDDRRRVAFDVHSRTLLLLPSYTGATWVTEVGASCLHIPFPPIEGDIHDLAARVEVHQGDHLTKGHLDVDTPPPSPVILHSSRRMEHVLPGVCTPPSRYQSPSHLYLYFHPSQYLPPRRHSWYQCSRDYSLARLHPRPNHARSLHSHPRARIRACPSSQPALKIRDHPPTYFL